MNKHLALLILKLMGWKVEGSLPDSIRKAIVVMAPHTSNQDFFMGWLGYSALGLHSKYLIKKEAFIFPFGWLVKKVGGIPVNRNRNSVLLQVADLFKNSEDLLLTITPEGTRSLNLVWKKGFYMTAHHAKVPLVLGFLDYCKKIGGLGPVLNITGDYQEDMKTIEAFYKEKTARFPKKFNLSPENIKKHRGE